jgi:hypothetical protein
MYKINLYDRPSYFGDNEAPKLFQLINYIPLLIMMGVILPHTLIENHFKNRPLLYPIQKPEKPTIQNLIDKV